MRTLLLVLIFALVSLSFGQEPEPSPQEPIQPAPDPIAQYIDLGVSIFAIVFGLLWVFFGYRLIRIVLFVAGFIVFFFILLNVTKTYATSLASWLHYVIAAGAGVIGGFLFVCLRKVGYFLFGFVLGVVVSAVIIGATPLVNLFTSGLIPLIIILSTGLVFAVAILFLERHLLIIGTSINGAFLVGTSVDNLALHTSVSSLLAHILTDFSNPLSFTGDWKPYTVLGGIVLLALVGIFVQFRFTGRDTSHEEKKDNREEHQFLLEKY